MQVELRCKEMESFQVLKYNQAIMSRMGLYSHCLNEPSNEFFKSFVVYYILIVQSVYGVLGSAVFTYKNWPQFENISNSCMLAVGCFACFGMFLSIGLKSKVVKILHLKLQGIVDDGEFSFIPFVFITIKLIASTC